MLSKLKNKLKTNEAEHWQKIKNSQSQFKIYWLLKLKIKVEAKVETETCLGLGRRKILRSLSLTIWSRLQP